MNIITRHEQRTLIADLLAAPGRIQELQVAANDVDRTYETMLANITWRAWSQPLFPGKREGDPERPAANDDERKLAVQLVIANDAEFQRIAALREDIHTRLAHERNKLDTAKIVAKFVGESAQ